MAIELSDEARTAARHLAITYQAYSADREAWAGGNINRAVGTCVWGRELLRLQEELGVTLLDPDLISTTVEAADRSQ